MEPDEETDTTDMRYLVIESIGKGPPAHIEQTYMAEL